MSRLQNKVALITGGDQGIGRGIALRFAKEGADVAIGYRSNRDGADDVVSRAVALGRKAVAIQGDVGIYAEGQRVVADALKEFHQIDLLVNNAGLERRSAFTEATEQDYDTVLNVNLKAVFFITQSLAKHWILNKRPGRVINISSVHEELPFPNFASYCASKGGVRMLTRTLAIELAPHSITVNGIAPGAIKTPINEKLLQDKEKLRSLLNDIPLRRMGEPEDVAGVAAFLASKDADYITGTTVFVDGGLLWNYYEQ